MAYNHQDLDQSGGREDQEQAKQQKHPRQSRRNLEKKSRHNQDRADDINNADLDQSGNLRR